MSGRDSFRVSDRAPIWKATDSDRDYKRRIFSEKYTPKEREWKPKIPFIKGVIRLFNQGRGRHDIFRILAGTPRTSCVIVHALTGEVAPSLRLPLGFL